MGARRHAVRQRDLIADVHTRALTERNAQLRSLSLWLDRVDTAAILRILFARLADHLRVPGDSVCWRGFGTWTVIERRERTGRHPRTHEPIQIRPRVTIAFRPDEPWREALQEKRDRRLGRRAATPAEPTGAHESAGVRRREWERGPA